MEHVLAIPIPLPGHMIPMLNLCCKLATRGCKKITILINEDKVETLTRLQQPLEENGHLLKGVVSVEVLPLTWPPAFTGGDEQLRLLFEQAEGMSALAHIAARKVKEESIVPVSCILADLLLGWSQAVAKEIGVPCIALSILALAEPAFVMHMISLGIHDRFPLHEQLTHVPGLPPLQASDIPRVSQYPNVNPTYWSYISRQHSRVKDAKYVLINSCYELERESYEVLSKVLPIRFVGPLLTPAAKHPPKSECLDWLDRKGKHSVVYISFGSMLRFTSSELEEILIGVEESGHSFLLSFRDDVLVDQASPTLTAFLERFSPQDGKKLEPNCLTEQGLVVPWAPQVEVLMHPSIGGFFTHYGWNSVSESMSAGVPLMGKPVLGDQFLMRKLVTEKWRNGVKIEEDANGEMSKSAIKDAVIRLMEDDLIRKTAAELKQVVERALNESNDELVSLFCCS